MPARRTLAFVAGGVAVAAVTAFGVSSVLDDDPDGTVETASVGGVALPDDAAGGGSTSTTTAGGASGAAAVVSLEELTGVLTSDGDDPDDLVIGGVDLDLGPDDWFRTAGPLADFDGDGTALPIAEELAALVGSEVTALVRFDDGDDDRDDADLYVLNDLTYRDPAGGPAPWQLGADGEGITREEAGAIAAGAVGEGATAREVSAEDDDGVAWEVEVVDAAGVEHDVDLGPDGTVLRVDRDD